MIHENCMKILKKVPKEIPIELRFLIEIPNEIPIEIPNEISKGPSTYDIRFWGAFFDIPTYPYPIFS